MKGQKIVVTQPDNVKKVFSSLLEVSNTYALPYQTLYYNLYKFNRPYKKKGFLIEWAEYIS